MSTYSRIEGQAVPEGRVRRWRIIVAEWIFGEHGSVRSAEIGQVHVLTVPEVNLDCLQDCEASTGGLEALMSALVESEQPGIRGPVLVIDSLSVRPGYRGRGFATLVAGEAFRWFDGLVSLAALAVTEKPKYRPATARVAEKLGFHQLKDDFWVKSLASQRSHVS